MDEDLLEQVTQRSDRVDGSDSVVPTAGSDLEQTKNPYIIKQHTVVMIH